MPVKLHPCPSISVYREESQEMAETICAGKLDEDRAGAPAG
jgi:hypothetical protein